MTKLPVYILAGGRSSRFGKDKARAIVDGKPLINQVASSLQQISSCTKVIADCENKYSDLGMQTIADDIPGKGPISGLHKAISDSLTCHCEGWFLLAACDLVQINSKWIEILYSHTSDVLSIVAFKCDRWEPLLGLYHTSIGSQVTKSLASGELSMQRLLDLVHATAVPKPNDWPKISQINTVDEQEAYSQIKVNLDRDKK